MHNENYEQSATRFGEMLQNVMADRNLTIRQLAERVGCTYEYARKLVRGLSLPAKYMLNTLERVLEFDMAEAQRLITADKIKKEHGAIPIELAGKNPELEPFERDWQRLTKQQKETLMSQFLAFIAQNKRNRIHTE